MSFTMVAIIGDRRGMCIGLNQPSKYVVFKCNECGEKHSYNTMAFHKH